jgi:HSP20 family protein
MDLHEDKEKNVVTASFEFPGVPKEDIQIDVQNGRLTVSAETTQSTDREESGYAVRERRFGKFARTLQLPQGIKVCVLIMCFQRMVGAHVVCARTRR